MLRVLAVLIYNFSGWKVKGSLSNNMPKQAIVVAAPHTSNWDFIYGILGFYMINMKINFLIKEDLFFFPLGNLLRHMGGVSVSRKRSNNIVETAVKGFESGIINHLIITPEATRGYNKRWKSGFYRIALAANVPIVFAFLDYSKKEAGVEKEFIPSGDFEKDIKEIKKFYSQFNAKFPENFCTD